MQTHGAGTAARIPLHVSDDELVRLSEANPGWHVERESAELVTMSPSGSQSSMRSVVAALQLAAWGRTRGVVFGCDAGFTMPDGALLAPDASWIASARWNELGDAEKERYARIVPDVVIEIVSPSDTLAEQRRKAESWHAYGAGYVVLVDPFRCESFTYGTAPAGLELDIEAIANPT